MPTLDPTDAAVVRSAITDMAAGLQGAPDRAINRMITRLALVYPNAKLSQAESDIRMETYIAALRDVPVDILAAGMDVMIRTQKFFPAIAEIRAAAGPALAARVAKLNGLKALALKHELEWREPEAEQVTPEQAAAIRAEEGFGRSGSAPGQGAARATTPATVADYIAHGFTEQQARDAFAERERILRRGAPASVGRATATAIDTITSAAA